MRRKGWFLSRSAPPERRQAATAQRLTARHRSDFCPRDRSSGQRAELRTPLIPAVSRRSPMPRPASMSGRPP